MARGCMGVPRHDQRGPTEAAAYYRTRADKNQQLVGYPSPTPTIGGSNATTNTNLFLNDSRYGPIAFSTTQGKERTTIPACTNPTGHCYNPISPLAPIRKLVVCYSDRIKQVNQVFDVAIDDDDDEETVRATTHMHSIAPVMPVVHDCRCLYNQPFHSFLGLHEDYVALVSPGHIPHYKKTLAFLLFGDRVRTIKLDWNQGNDSKNLPTSYIEKDGSKYELLSVKVHRPQSGSFVLDSMLLQSSKLIQAQYVCTSGFHQGTASSYSDCNKARSSLHLQAELEKIADFGCLTVEKVAARLELLQSTALMYRKTPLVYDTLTADYFEEIEEFAHEGCGFMPCSFAQRFLGNHSVGQRTFAVQVRIIAPKFGIFKGMLVEKYGIDKIQLPPSMKKVGPSTKPGSRSNRIVYFLINAIFPSHINAQYLPRILAGGSAPRSFRPKILGPMVTQIFHEWPILKDVIDGYVQQSQAIPAGPGLQHANLVGLADPTGCIPPGTVFITGSITKGGMNPIQREHTIFVTRFPCTEAATDAHLVQNLTQRPKTMSPILWKWLLELPFGAIIFGNPISRTDTSLPCKISNGDLDGDLYFVCWNKEILEDLRVTRVPHSNVSDGDPQQEMDISVENSFTTKEKSSSDFICNTTKVQVLDYDRAEWFQKGQTFMSNINHLSNLNKLVIYLYKRWKDKYESHNMDNLKNNIDNHDNTLHTRHGTILDHSNTVRMKDYIYFGRAYKAALDLSKHGGLVELPFHLWKALPVSLHSYLCDSTSKE